MITWTVRLSVITTHCCERQPVSRCPGRISTHHRGLAVELGVAQDGGRGVVEDVQELCQMLAVTDISGPGLD